MKKRARIVIPGLWLLAAASPIPGAPQYMDRGSRGGVMSMDARKILGHWSGRRTERNPVTGLPFTLNFEFEFRSDGSFTEQAGFGRLTVLRLQGRYSIRRAHYPGDPSITHAIELVPVTIVTKPSEEDLRAFLVADLPAIDRTEQLVNFYDLAPAGAATLRDARPGSESWGLQRVP